MTSAQENVGLLHAVPQWNKTVLRVLRVEENVFDPPSCLSLPVDNTKLYFRIKISDIKYVIVKVDINNNNNWKYQRNYTQSVLDFSVQSLLMVNFVDFVLHKFFDEFFAEKSSTVYNIGIF